MYQRQIWIQAALLGGLLTTAMGQDGSTYADHRPIFSDQGRSIIFMSNRDQGDWELYRMQLDGQNIERLTENSGWDGYASLSPDGRLLAFDSLRDGRNSIALLDLTSRKVTILVQSEASLGGTQWAPDGSQIVYMSEQTGDRELFLMAPDGGNQRQLTHTPGPEGDAVFSPDGRRLVFSARPADRKGGIEIMTLSSGARERLLQSEGRLYGLNWSPDGRQIVFNSDEDGDQELFLFDLDSRQKTQLTRNQVDDHLPVWSPDGKCIIYTSEVNEREQIFLRVMPDGITVRVSTQ